MDIVDKLIDDFNNSSAWLEFFIVLGGLLLAYVCVRFWGRHLKHKATVELQLEEELRRALAEDRELELHYQPILALAGNRLGKLEALVRWRHPQRGLLTPERFVGIAEANGFIT